jgi:hypothetical protein
MYFFSEDLRFTRLDGGTFTRGLLKILHEEYPDLMSPFKFEPPFEFVELRR